MYTICDIPNNIYVRYYWLVPQTLLNFAATILCLPNSNVESNEVRVFQNWTKLLKSKDISKLLFFFHWKQHSNHTRMSTTFLQKFYRFSILKHPFWGSYFEFVALVGVTIDVSTLVLELNQLTLLNGVILLQLITNMVWMILYSMAISLIMARRCPGTLNKIAIVLGLLAVVTYFIDLMYILIVKVPMIDYFKTWYSMILEIYYVVHVRTSMCLFIPSFTPCCPCKIERLWTFPYRGKSFPSEWPHLCSFDRNNLYITALFESQYM